MTAAAESVIIPPADDRASSPGAAVDEASGDAVLRDGSLCYPPQDEGHPPGDYAIVEIMGHQTLVGRVAEVTRFGAAMLQIEPIFAGRLLAPVLQSGAAIYRFTPCDADIAFARAPKENQRWALPDAIKATLPPDLLPAPATKPAALVIDEDAILGDGAMNDDFDEADGEDDDHR